MPGPAVPLKHVLNVLFGLLIAPPLSYAVRSFVAARLRPLVPKCPACHHRIWPLRAEGEIKHVRCPSCYATWSESDDGCKAPPE